MSKTPRTDEAWEKYAKDSEYGFTIALQMRTEMAQLETELADLKTSEQRFAKCFERIAKAVGVTSPLILMSMAENDEENYAEILARYIEKIDSNTTTIKAQFAEYVRAEDNWRNTVIGSHRDEKRLTASQLRSKARKTLGL